MNTQMKKRDDLSEMFATDASPRAAAEGMDSGAFALPFLSILQGLSPQVQRGTPQYLAGAAPGMIYNTVTKDLAESRDVVVLRRTHTYCFWQPRDAGGGFRGENPATDALDKQFQQLLSEAQTKRDTSEKKGVRVITPEGLEMTSHRNFFCVQRLEDGSAEPVVVSMARTQNREAMNWNTLINTKSFRTADGLNLQSEIW